MNLVKKKKIFFSLRKIRQDLDNDHNLQQSQLEEKIRNQVPANQAKVMFKVNSV